MPGARRLIPRVQGTASILHVGKLKHDAGAANISTNQSGQVDEGDGQRISNNLTPPRHSHIPEIPMDGNLVFELMVLCNSILGLGLQYVNLYKTVWWLPYSHANYALNFYLIDPYLAMFLILLMSRRVIWHITQNTSSKDNRNYCYYLGQIIRFFAVIGVIGLYMWTGYNVILRHSLLHILYLAYPFDIRPLFCKTVYRTPLTPTDKSGKLKTSRDAMSSKETLHHGCATSPEQIRDEVECLKTDFNHRIKQVLFNSMLCAYYMGFVPVCFAQNTLYYDTWWVTQHIVLIWIGSFILFVVQFLPAKYVDVLHRCSLHLGRWIKVEHRMTSIPSTAWSELQAWPQGALVKHVRGMFKAEGINNSAEPGNGMHARFYFIFHQPLRVTNWMLVLTWALVLYQLFNLAQATEWSHIISLAVLPFANYWVLFKLMRDRMVLARAYKESPNSASTSSTST